MKPFLFLSLSASLIAYVESVDFTVTTNADSGAGSLRQAILDLNTSGVPGTISFNLGIGTITLASNLPVVQHNVTIQAPANQIIDGANAFRLFATQAASLTLENCTLQNGVAIGGAGGPSNAFSGAGGGGLGAGGGIYIDRNQTSSISNVILTGNEARGGVGGDGTFNFPILGGGGGGASFSIASADGTTPNGGGDNPGVGITGGSGTGTGIGYGGGNGGDGQESPDSTAGGTGGGNEAGSPGVNNLGGNGGYCGGGGGGQGLNGAGGGGGNGGGDGSLDPIGGSFGGGGGGIGSGGAGGTLVDVAAGGGGGGFGGGGGGGIGGFRNGGGGGGGWGGGGGGGGNTGFGFAGLGGFFGGTGGQGNGSTSAGGGGGGIGGGIFVGDGATLFVGDGVSCSGNSTTGGTAGMGDNPASPGSAYADDIFLFQQASLVFNGTSNLSVPFSIQSDQSAPINNLDAGVIQQGSAIVTLTSGSNNYLGGTTVNSGTLALSGAGIISSTGSVTVNAGSFDLSSIAAPSLVIGDLSGVGGNVTLGANTLIEGTTASTSYAGVIQGIGGSFVKQGSGTLTLTGGSTYTGTTTIDAGIVIVNGSLISTVLINSGTTLRGIGTIGGATVQSGGIIAPGNNTIGTLNSSGPVTFNAGSIFQVEINPSNSSLLQVIGSATLAGNVNVIQDPGSYSQTGQYEIVNASSIIGAFDPTVSGGQPGFQFSLNQIGNSIFLSYISSIIPPSPPLPLIPTAGLSGNAKRIADYLNKHGSLSTLSLFDGLTGHSLKQALNSVSPGRNAFGTYIAEQTAFSLSGVVTAHLDSMRLSGKELPKDDLMAILTADASDQIIVPLPHIDKKPNQFCFWVSGLGEVAHQTASSQNPSFKYLSDAVVGGLDYCGNDKTIVGGALGYAHTHFHESDHAGHGNIDYYFTSLYGNGYLGNFYFSPAIWGIFNKIHNTRNISFSGYSEKAKADIFAWQCVPHLEIGYDCAFHKGDIVPFTSVDWAIAWERDYTEHGASPFNAKQKSHTTSILRSETGIKFSRKWQRDWGAFFLQEKLAYIFENPYGTQAINTSFVGTPGSFTIAAVNKNLNLGAIGMDFLAAVGKIHPVKIRLGYEGEFGAHYTSNQLMFTLSKEF